MLKIRIVDTQIIQAWWDFFDEKPTKRDIKTAKERIKAYWEEWAQKSFEDLEEDL